MSLLRVSVSRVASALATLLVVSILVFLAIHLVPGGYEKLLLGPFQTPEAQARVAEQFALDASLPQQFLTWIGNVVRGDLGVSLVTQGSVGDELLRRAAPTIQLTTMAAGMAVLVGAPLGFVAGLSNGRPVVRSTSRFLGAAGLSVPDFVLGTIFVFVFSKWSLGLTVGGYVPFLEDPITNLRAMILPAVSLGVFGIALVMRTTRDAVLSALAEPYIGAAVARGERPASIVFHHLIRNSAIPVVTVVATFVGVLLGGAVIVESLFTVPGIGTYIVNSINNRDYAVLQGGVLVAAAIFITVNMIADILYTVIDPRVARRKANA